MGKKLSIMAFIISMLIFLPIVPFIGAILGIIDLKRKDPDSIRGLSLGAVWLGTIQFVVFVVGLVFIRLMFN